MNEKFKIDLVELKPGFSYYELDRLRSVDPLNILRKNDDDELYQIYIKTYEPFVEKNKLNLIDFYLWVTDNYCVYLDDLIDKMSRFYNKNNPFNEDYYMLNPMIFLYNKELIDEIPIIKRYKIDKNCDIAILPKNEYRVEPTNNARIARSFNE